MVDKKVTKKKVSKKKIAKKKVTKKKLIRNKTKRGRDPYDGKALYKEAVKCIKDHKLIFVSDVTDMLHIDPKTYYKYIKEGSVERQNVQNLLRGNKLSTRVDIRNKWRVSDHFQSQLALYRLCATEEELDLLDIGGRREKSKPPLTESQIDRIIKLTTPSPDDVRKLYEQGD